MRTGELAPPSGPEGSSPPYDYQDDVDGSSGPSGPRRRRFRHSRPSSRRRPWWLVVIAAPLAVIVLLAAVSIVGALRTPGNEDFKAKWGDWLRSHHATVLVNHLENFYYSHTAPKRGGRPAGLNPVPGTRAKASPGGAPALPGGAPTTPAGTAASPAGVQTTPAGAAAAPGGAPASPAGAAHLQSPAAIPLVVSPAMPGEGQWQPVGPLVGGSAGMYVAQFRADTVYTGQITSAVWIDPTLLRVALVPGLTEPGGTWPEPPDITGPAVARALAAFNGGFRFQDAHGGFYLDGRQAVPLRTGAASMVLYASGRLDIGTWGSDVTMTPDVQAVLQNLVLIVDHGQPAPSATYRDARIWGATLGANTVVARSGIGVTATGALVYVAGPALTARSLAESLQRAGAVRAMALDINPEWVTFNFYQHDPTNPLVVTGSKLYPQMQRPATRFLGPTRESREFFTVSLPG